MLSACLRRLVSERRSVIRKTIDLPKDDIARLCRKYGVRELAIFGSA